jgi:hypothetical protein
MPRKTDTDRIIEANEQQIKTLIAVNDALRALRDAKKRTPKAKE